MEIFPAVELSDTKATLLYVRRPKDEEKAKFSPEWQEMIFFAVDRSEVQIPWRQARELAHYNQVTNHRPAGSLPGCSNSLWLISQEEWDAIAEEYRQSQEPAQKAEKEEIQPSEEEALCLQAHYGNSEKAWDAGDERAWAILHEAEVRSVLTGRGGPGRGQGRKAELRDPVTLTFKVGGSVAETVKERARKEGRSYAELLREIIEHHFNE